MDGPRTHWRMRRRDRGPEPGFRPPTDRRPRRSCRRGRRTRALRTPRRGFLPGHPDLPGMLMSHRVAIVAISSAATVGDVNALLDELDAEIAGGIPGVANHAAALMALRLPGGTHQEMESALTIMRARPFVAAAAPDVELIGDEVPSANAGRPLWQFDSDGLLDTWGLV